jgi:SNF2 family DNA or RNA helicase
MQIRVEKVGKRIHLKSDYDPVIPVKCKLIAGARWAPSLRVWTFPLDYGTCVRLREEFQHALVIGPELKAWAKEAKKKQEELLSIASSLRADLGALAEVSPALAKAMANRPYQQVGSAWLARAKQGLLGDHPGLGKTLQAMGAVVEAGITGPILVFAPKTACIITWTEELQKWLPDDMVYCVTAINGRDKRNEALHKVKLYYDAWAESAEQMESPEPRMWILCNIEMARCEALYEDPEDEYKVTGLLAKHEPLFDIVWSTIIVDESHKALITKYSQAKKQTQQRAGMSLLPARENALKIAMSGTPMRGKKYNIWGTLNWLRPELYPSFWKWSERYFEIFKDGYGWIIGDLREDMTKAFYRDLDGIMLRRTKDEVLADLPPKMYAGVRLEGQHSASAPGHWIPMGPEQTRNYLQLEKEAEIDLDGQTLMANGSLAIRTRLKQFASATWKFDGAGELMPCRPSNKLDWLEEFLRDRGILGEEPYGNAKVLVASQSTRLLNFFSRELEALGVPNHLLTGETKPERRKQMVRQFQDTDEGPRVFLFNTTAGGVSLTLDAADDVVILDELDVPDDQEQVEDRAHRASSMHQVMIHYVRSEGTIETDIAIAVGDKEFDQKEMLDLRRGVKIDKDIVDDWKWPKED